MENVTESERADMPTICQLNLSESSSWAGSGIGVVTSRERERRAGSL